MISGGERSGTIERNPMYMNVGTSEEEDDNNKNALSASSHSGVQRQYPTRVQQDGDRRCIVIAYGILLVIVVSLLSVIAHQQALAYLQLNALTDDVGVLADATAVSASSSQQRPWETGHATDSVLLLEKDQRYGSYVARIPLQFVEEQQAMLLVEQVTRGIGLRSLYWDPGNIVSQHLCRFHFLGNDNTTIVLGSPNQKFRSSQSAFIQRSFSDSVLWRGSVLHRDAQNVWVDVSDLFRMPQGYLAEKTLLETLSAAYGAHANFSLEAGRSSLEIADLHASSASTTIAADLHATYSWSSVSSAVPTELMDNVASGRLISTSVRRSLHVLAPPDEPSAYTRRPFHPKCGFNYISLMNEDASLFANRQELYVLRHRLTQPSPPGAASDGFGGIVYLVDAAIPDTYRAAIMDGIQWWDEAFVAAGYPEGTLRVHVAPSGFDPYDLFRSFTLPGDGRLPRTTYARVHFVQWIDRDVRAYSLGQRVIDPRSGEILHGHVRIEGLRLRQDAMVAEALVSPYGDDGSFLNETVRRGIVGMVLQRVKHLGAHEVGHSLGLTHNFAGSSYAAQASLAPNTTSSPSSFRFATVMDYPPPIVRLLQDDGSPVVNKDAYANGIGDFDKVSVQYAYGVFPSGEDEASALTRWIVRAERQLGYTFETDQDSSISSADWQDTKWDINHGNVLGALNTSLTIRARAMRQLGLHSLHNRSAVSHLRALIPIVYLWHRYDVEAVGKLLGGYTIQYPLRDDYRWGSPRLQSVPFNASLQWRALDLLIECLLPRTLSFPLARWMPWTQTTAFGFVEDIGGEDDLFTSRRGSSRELDPLVMYQVATQIVLDMLLDATRVERLAQQPMLFPSDATDVPDVESVFEYVFERIFPPTNASATCAFLGEHLGYEYMTMLATWKTALATASNRQGSSTFSFLAGAGLRSVQLSFTEKLQSLAVLVSGGTCSVEQLQALYEASHAERVSARQVQIIQKSLSMLATVDGPPRPSVPLGPPI